MTITNQDRANIRRIFQKTRDGIEPRVAKRAKQMGMPAEKQLVDIMAAQNALRCCMEVVFNECLPYDEKFCAELGARLAAYAISATPIEHHVLWVDAVQKIIPDVLKTKLQEGAIIRATWLTDGVEHPNVPAKGDIQ